MALAGSWGAVGKLPFLAKTPLVKWQLNWRFSPRVGAEQALAVQAQPLCHAATLGKAGIHLTADLGGVGGGWRV